MSASNESSHTLAAAKPVFVSYTHADRKYAQLLVEILESEGFSVWWDAQIYAGERFQHITEQALEGAQCVIVIWSKRSVQSSWVLDEATRGRERNCLVPVTIDHSDAPLGFRQFQVIDLTGNRLRANSPEVEKVVHAVAALAEQGTARPLPRRTFLPIDRRTLVLGGGAIAALGTGAAIWRSELFDDSLPRTGSVAVLPFENLSGDASQDYFSEGLSEEIRATLSLNDQLAVVAQTSSNSFRDKEVPATEIARSLNVAHLLGGSVRRVGEVVRIAAHLIDGRDGFEDWSRSFERRIDDIFGVQIEIAYLVVDALVARLASGAQPELKRVGGTANVDAYDAFLRGNALYASAVDEATDREALAMFDRAIELDPAYALAHVARARSLMIIAGNYSTGEELASFYDEAQSAAERSVDISPDLADAHSVLGFVFFNGRLDAQAAMEPYRKSYELGFGNADTLSRFARFAAQVGNFQDAHTAIRRAKELDPLNQGLLRSEAVIDYDARDFVKAARTLRAALRDNPKSPGPNYMLGNIAFLEGNLDAARARYLAEPQQMARTGGLAMIAFKSGETERGETLLRRLADEFGDNSLYVRAQVRAQAGQHGEALAMLEQALAIGDSGLVQLRNDPLLDGLRSDPAFIAMLAKIGFDV